MSEQKRYCCPNCLLHFQVAPAKDGYPYERCGHKINGRVCFRRMWSGARMQRNVDGTKTRGPATVGIHPDDVPREHAA